MPVQRISALSSCSPQQVVEPEAHKRHGCAHCSQRKGAMDGEVGRGREGGMWTSRRPGSPYLLCRGQSGALGAEIRAAKLASSQPAPPKQSRLTVQRGEVLLPLGLVCCLQRRIGEGPQHGGWLLGLSGGSWAG